MASILYFMKSAKQKEAVKFFALSHFLFFVLTISEIAVLVALFRPIRAIFGSGEGSIDTVGYTQYFGYPTYFDSLYMFFLVALPCINYLLVTLFFHEKK